MNVKANEIGVGDVILTRNARGVVVKRQPVTAVGPCLTDNHARHIATYGNDTYGCYSVLPDLEIADPPVLAYV